MVSWRIFRFLVRRKDWFARHGLKVTPDFGEASREGTSYL
jgi:hypothetical protein